MFDIKTCCLYVFGGWSNRWLGDTWKVNVSPIIGPPYAGKGEFIDTNGIDVYTAGPAEATKAIFMIYDIFGYSSQILEGADKLAEHYRIFMPDFFEGKPAPMDWMPMDGGVPDEAKMDDFCNGPGETQQTLRKLESLVTTFQELHPEIKAWGLLGYCWGGYVSHQPL